MSNAATSADEIAEDNGEDKSIDDDDDDDDGVVQESICNKATKQSFQKCSQEPLLDKIFSH
jgi:hypothetical protein